MKRIFRGRTAVLVLVLVLALPGVAAAQSERPTVRTDAVTELTPTSATLNGLVDPNGAETVYFFQYGPTSLYGSSTPVTSAGARNRGVGVSAPVGGLQPATLYHYRVVAENRNGLVRGRDRTFRTPPVPLGLSLAANPASVPFGRPTTLAGVLTGTGNAGQQVALQFNPWPYTQGFLNVGNVLLTNPDGGFAFPILSVPVNTNFRVVMPQRPGVISAEVPVGVLPRVSSRATPRRVRRGRRVRFSGRITPAVDGQPIEVQRLVRGVWTPVARGTARDAGDARSRFRRRVKIRRSGSYRVVVQTTNGAYTPNHGRTFNIRIRRR